LFRVQNHVLLRVLLHLSLENPFKLSQWVASVFHKV
jgi:hypothetical protein